MALPASNREHSKVSAPYPALLTACVILFIFSINLLWESAAASPGIDYYQVWVAAQAVRNNTVRDIYSRDADSVLADRYLLSYRGMAPSDRHRAVANKCRELGLTGTPFLYAALGAITSGDYDRDYRVFQFMSVAGLAASLAILSRLLGVATPAWLIVGALMANWFAPILSDTMVGNVSRLQLLMLAGAAWLLGGGRGAARVFAGGVVLGCAVLFKPNIGLVGLALGIWWAVNREFVRLAWTAGGGAVGAMIAVVSSAAFFGTARCWSNWFDMIRHLQERYQPTTTMGNFGAAELLRSGLGRDVSLILLGGITLILAAGMFFARRRLRAGDRAAQTVLVIGIGGAAWLLSTWLVWLHYYTLLAPLILYSVADRPKGSGRMTGLCQRCSLVVALVTWNQILLESFGRLDTRYWAIASVFAAGLLVAVALSGLIGSGTPGPSPGFVDNRQSGG